MSNTKDSEARKASYRYGKAFAFAFAKANGIKNGPKTKKAKMGDRPVDKSKLGVTGLVDWL
jgi:hypothetical protein